MCEIKKKIILNIGDCIDFEIHPSNDYVIILSLIGFLYIFKIYNAELRGKIIIGNICRSKDIYLKIYIIYRFEY